MMLRHLPWKEACCFFVLAGKLSLLACMAKHSKKIPPPSPPLVAPMMLNYEPALTYLPSCSSPSLPLCFRLSLSVSLSLRVSPCLSVCLSVGLSRGRRAAGAGGARVPVRDRGGDVAVPGPGHRVRQGAGARVVRGPVRSPVRRGGGEHYAAYFMYIPFLRGYMRS